MKRTPRLLSLPLSLLLAALLAASCGSSDTTISAGDSPMTTISGDLVYRERIALTPGGTATVTISDISLQDVVSPVIAETTIELSDSQIPISFDFAFDPIHAAPNGTYAVRATIHGPDGDLEWTTDTTHQVDLAQSVIDVGSLLLVRATRDEPNAADASSIVGEWSVTAINNKAVIPGSSATLVFDADASLGGNASCNSYATTYAADDAALTIGTEIATTMMACDVATDQQERAFLAALNAISATDAAASFEIDGHTLTLVSSDGATIEAIR